MKILLLNDNPVVNKLVTLSAQKTSDELEVVASIDAISSDTYDLLVVDDNLYNDSLFDDIKARATFSQSLYICSRDAEQVEEFSSSIKKPFLPTDLVELFSVISHDLDTIDLSSQEEEPNIVEDELVADALEEEISLDELNNDEELVLDDDELGLNDDEELTLDEDELELDEDLSLDTEINESVLDHEEAQKVKDLLDETSEDLDEELELEEEDEPEEELELDEELELEEEDEPEEELQLEEELELEEEDESEEELELDEELELEEEDESEEELELEEEDESEEELELEEEDDEVEEELELDEELELEDQIKAAVNELSEEDLNSEVNEKTLLDIASNEINSFDTLTSKDLKMAIGEEVDETEDAPEEEITVETEVESEEAQTQTDTTDNGVEALKRLLEALTDKDVAASMKGMKISINITLGNN